MGGAFAVGWWIKRSRVALRELHFSHNYVPYYGFPIIFDSLARNSLYPASPGPGCLPAPLWFRMEYNCVESPDQLLSQAEHKMQEARSKEFPELPRLECMACVIEQWDSRGCRNDNCYRSRNGQC